MQTNMSSLCAQKPGSTSMIQRSHLQKTFLDAFVGAFLTTGVLSAVAADGVVDVSVLGKAGIAALAAGVIGLLNFVKNWAEDNSNLPALLKSPASDGLNPEP
jgi:hypothetical protein